jgi:hypothetical protein
MKEVQVTIPVFDATAGALINVKGASPTLKLGEEKVVFDMRHSTHLGQEISQCHRIGTLYQCIGEKYQGKQKINEHIRETKQSKI